MQELLGAIQSEADFESLRNNLNSKGITKEEHKDFLESIKQTVEAIEEVRNCIAHNRAIPNRTLNSYYVAKTRLEEAIRDFWTEVSLEGDVANERWPWEEDALRDVKALLQEAQWDETAQRVQLQVSGEEPTAKVFTSQTDLQEYLEQQALAAACAAFPSDREDRERAEEHFSSTAIVREALKGFKKHLLVVGWL